MHFEGYFMLFRSIVATLTTSASLIWITSVALAAPVVRRASGPDPASIQGAITQFQADLGGVNNGVGGSFATGRREINWDGVPDSFAAPNALPANFFNNNSPRGLLLQTPGTGFQVSGNTGVAPTEFDNINPTYSSLFRTFSPQRLFTAIGSTVTQILFFIPGTSRPATVNGFGAVFTDVDRRFTTRIDYLSSSGDLLWSQFVPTAGRNTNGTLSFVGVSFNAGERVALVQITSGNTVLGPDTNEEFPRNIVVMDDFIYGEPQLIQRGQ